MLLLLLTSCAIHGIDAPPEALPDPTEAPAAEVPSPAEPTPESASGYDLIDDPEVIAIAGELPIRSRALSTAATRFEVADLDRGSLSADERREVLSDLIDEALLLAQARALGFESDPTIEKVTVNTLLRESVYNQIRNSDFTEEMLQAYFAEHASEFQIPEKILVHRLMIVSELRGEADARALAERLRDEIAADPERFSEIASEHSEGPYRRRGGDLGFISPEGKSTIPAATTEAAFAMETGAVSPVLTTEGGFEVLYVELRRDAVTRTYQQLKGTVLRKAKNEALQAMYDDYVLDLAERAEIFVAPDRVAERGADASALERPFEAAAGLSAGVVARVDGADVTGDDLEAALADREDSSTLSETDVLQRLLDHELLLAEAYRQGLDRDPKVERTMVNTLLRAAVYDHIENDDFTEDELRAFHAEHADDFMVPEKIQIRRLFLRIDSVRGEAETLEQISDLRARAQADPDGFTKLVSLYSEGPYQRRSGDMGFVSREGKPGIEDALIDRAFELEIGALSEPIRDVGGYSLIRVEARREAVTRTFEQLHGSVLRTVKNQRYDALREAYLAELRSQAEIQIFEDRLDALELVGLRAP